MATGIRVSRVAESIRREVSQMLLHGIKDERVGSGMVTVTDVYVSGDLQHTKIFVSIYGTDEVKAAAMEGLHSAAGYVRSLLGQRVRLRRTPEVIFVEDRSIERGMRVLSLLNQLSDERKDSEEIAEEPDEKSTEKPVAEPTAEPEI
jgi:ribosome-binding factor A